MNTEQKNKIIQMLNSDDFYGIDFKTWYVNEKPLFEKEDNDIFQYINHDQNSILFIDKLRTVFQIIPEADYMYYYNNEDCLLSSLIKNKKEKVTHELLKEKIPFHAEKITKKNIHNENVLQILVKNIHSADDWMDGFTIIHDISRVSEHDGDKKSLFLNKDNEGKDFIDYFCEKMNNYHEDYEYINEWAYNFIHTLSCYDDDILSHKECDYMKILWPLFKSHTEINGDEHNIEALFLKIKAEQERNQLNLSLNSENNLPIQIKKRI